MHGSADPGVPRNHVKGIEPELRKRKKTWMDSAMFYVCGLVVYCVYLAFPISMRREGRNG